MKFNALLDGWMYRESAFDANLIARFQLHGSKIGAVERRNRCLANQWLGWEGGRVACLILTGNKVGLIQQTQFQGEREHMAAVFEGFPRWPRKVLFQTLTAQ